MGAASFVPGRGGICRPEPKGRWRRPHDNRRRYLRHHGEGGDDHVVGVDRGGGGITGRWRTGLGACSYTVTRPLRLPGARLYLGRTPSSVPRASGRSCRSRARGRRALSTWRGKATMACGVTEARLLCRSAARQRAASSASRALAAMMSAFVRAAAAARASSASASRLSATWPITVSACASVSICPPAQPLISAKLRSSAARISRAARRASAEEVHPVEMRQKSRGTIFRMGAGMRMRTHPTFRAGRGRSHIVRARPPLWHTSWHSAVAQRESWARNRVISQRSQKQLLDLAGGPGFEPGLTDSESAVLPLNYPPAGCPRDKGRGGARQGFGPAGGQASGVEEEVQNVAVSHPVGLALDAHPAGFLGALLAVAGDEGRRRGSSPRG